MKPETPIKPTLEEVGYPFKSKYHSKVLAGYQKNGNTETVEVYLGHKEPKSGKIKFSEHLCPKILKYQFSEDFDLKVSSKCCDKMKKEPLHKWQRENNKPYAIIGVMRDEGGARTEAQCLAFNGKKLKAFQPLAPVTKEWEEWLINEYNVEICPIYYPPYNFQRTGCKGCPFARDIQKNLDVLERFFPNERKQCEIIWEPVYKEYRRLNYRLKENRQLSFDDLEVKA